MIEMYKQLCAGIVLFCSSLVSLPFEIPCGGCLFSVILLLHLADYPIVSIEDPFDKEDWELTKYFSTLQTCQVRFVFPSTV